MNIPGVYNEINTEQPKKEVTDKERAQLKRLQEVLRPGAITKVSLASTKVKVETRENGKGMKITFKLDKEESIAFTNLCNMSKPDGISVDQFVKFLVFKGFQTFEKELKERVEKFKEDNPEEYAKIEAEARAAEESSIEPMEQTEDPKAEIIKD